jgi:Putative transposase, YhgA-like
MGGASTPAVRPVTAAEAGTEAGAALDSAKNADPDRSTPFGHPVRKAMRQHDASRRDASVGFGFVSDRRLVTMNMAGGESAPPIRCSTLRACAPPAHRPPCDFFMIGEGRPQLYFMNLLPALPPRRTRPRPSRGAALMQPHDAIFRWTFSQQRHAVGLLQATLPRALVAATDWSTLRLENGGYVSQALRGRHCDLVFSVQMGGKAAYFYVLVEQQRRVEPLMIFRMSVYMTRLWEHIVRDHPDAKELPLIYPLLIHHSDTGWTAATAFQDIVATGDAVRSELLPYIPHFAMRLLDLSPGQVQDLVERALTAMARVVLWCLSVAGDDGRMVRESHRIGSALAEVLRAPDRYAALEVLLRYLSATHERFTVKKIGKLLEKAAGPEAREVIVTGLDKLERRGERKGQAKMLLGQLAVRFSSVPDEVSARVMAADEATLTRWAMRVLTAPTLESVLDEDRAGATPTRRASASKRAH